MKQVTTITLTFQLSHESGQRSIDNIRRLIGNLHDYNCDENVELITDEDIDEYTFVIHDGNKSRQFRFNNIDTFVMKYAKFGAGEIAAILRDYGTFVECNSKTEEVEDGEQK